MSDWQEASLADLADYINGRAIKPEECSTKEGIPVIRIKQINDPQSIEDRFCGDDLDEKNIARSGDLLFSWSATLKTILWQGPAGAINQHIFKVLPKDGIDKTFLHYLIDHSLPALTEESHGSTMKHIKKSALSAFHLQIPPLPEQKKIAEILSGFDNTIEKLRKKKTKHQSLLASMRQGIFNEESANTCMFDQIVWERMLGTTRRGVGNGESIPLVKMGDIARGDVKLGENERIQYGDDLDELLLQRGDILFNTRNTPALVGKTAIYDSDERCTYDNNLMRIRVAPGNDPWFLNHLMNSPQFLQLLTRITAGTTSVAAIYWNDLRRVKIPLPPITRQKQVAKSIQSVLSVIYDLSAEICCLDELKNALSSDLLSGRKRVSI